MALRLGTLTPSKLYIGATEVTKAFLGTTEVYSSAAPALWTPAALGSALALWLDADDAATVTLNGSTVSQWRDKSGNSRHVSQASASLQPTYIASSLNGRAGLDWGPATNSKVLSRSGFTYSPVRLFGVADYDGSSPSTALRGLVSHTRVIDADVFMLNSSGVEWWAVTLGTNKAFLNGSSTSSSVALPTIINPFVFATDQAPQANRTDVFVGMDRTFSGRGWVGKIYEIIETTTVPLAVEKAKLEGYLAWKWGTVASLPSGHPYKNGAPTL